MPESTLILLSAAVAAFMVTLVRAGFPASLRAAIRTTVIVVIGWGLACAHYRLNIWSHLSLPVSGMLVVSALAVVFAWLFHFRAVETHSVSHGTRTDRFNVGFAVAFAVLLILNNIAVQSVFLGIILVGGAAVLAFASR